MMSVVEQVKEDVTDEFVRFAESMGLQPTMIKVYMSIFFSKDPVGLKEISKDTGYSVSTICNTMPMIEKFTDIRRFKKPGSKKIYFECLHDVKVIQKKKLEEGLRAIRSFTKQLEESEKKLDDDGSEEAKRIKEDLARIKSAYSKVNKAAPLIEKLMGIKTG